MTPYCLVWANGLATRLVKLFDMLNHKFGAQIHYSFRKSKVLFDNAKNCIKLTVSDLFYFKFVWITLSYTAKLNSLSRKKLNTLNRIGFT